MAMVSVSHSFLTFNSPNHLRISRRRFSAMASSSSTTGVRVTEGEGNLPKLVLTSPQNSGGIPHCFPQFGPGEIQQHGFGRNMDWSVVDSESADANAAVTLELKDGPYSRAMWDFGFQALYKVVVGADSLSTELKVTNTDNKAFSFSTALHTYFRASVTGASVRGLKGCKTLNKDPDPKNPIEGKEDRDAVTFPGFVDCVYLDAPNELQFDNGLGDKIIIKNTNWSDAVLWNPHTQMEACYRDSVCVENAKLGDVKLEPGQSWIATQLLSIS